MAIRANKRGVSLVIVAISLVAITGITALAVDIGNTYYEKSRLDKATQLAALTAAQTMYTSNDPQYIKQKALDTFKENGLNPDNANIQINVSNGNETALVSANLNIPFYFAKIFGFKDINLSSNALAELNADGTARLIDEHTYDFVPWGIPHGELTYDSNADELLLNGLSLENWHEDPNFSFQVGEEYILKLGEGVAGDAIGRKILIPMDGYSDVYPPDDLDPICPEYGSRIQSEYLKAYGLVYWCLQHGYNVEWILDYNGGAFLIDYHEDILNAVSETGVDYSNVTKIILTASQAATLSNWLANHKNSENRDYEIVTMDQPFKVAVFTQNEYKPADLMPWGILSQDGSTSYPFGYKIGDKYILKYGTGGISGNPSYQYKWHGNWGALAMGGNGANVYRNNIKYGVNVSPGRTYYTGKYVYTQPGNMVGPTFQGLRYRLDNGKIYVKVPVVNNLDVNGRKRVKIIGFLNFKLTELEGENSHGWVYGEFVDKVPPEYLSYSVNENLDNEIVAKALKMAGIPFDWIHDEDALNDNIYNYDWIYTHHEDFYNEEVAYKIAEWVSKGHYFFNMCWATDRFDNALAYYNHKHFGDNTNQYIPLMFFKAHDTMQMYRCYRCKNWALDSDCCFYSGWIREYVRHTEINTTLNYNYYIRPRDIMQTQNHVTVIPKDGMIGRTHAFRRNYIINEFNILAKDNANKNYKEGIIAWMNSTTAKMLTRTYRINPNDPGGIVTFYGGHDPAKNKSNIPAYRLILNNVLAGSQAPAVARNSISNYGALDLDCSEESNDNLEYLSNIKYGFEKWLYPGMIVDTIDDNLPTETNEGIDFNVGNDSHTYPDIPEDSSRIILVPIVSTYDENGNLVCKKEVNIEYSPTNIYSISGRDKVRIIGIAKFWLLNINKMDERELDINRLGPIKNGQVRGIFLGYFVNPIQ